MFEKFRNKSLKNYELCPSHHLSIPDLSCDAILEMTKTYLEIIPDSVMYIFFEKGTRRGIYFIFNRYSQANKKYLKSYGPKYIILNYVIYLDANNIYGYAILKFFVASGF